MFTGIVEERGVVSAVDRDDDRASLRVACREVLGDAAVGASIAVDGCCVTVADVDGDGFRADLMAETLATTALGALEPGDRVNLERPLAADGRLGGHIVQGHVDGVGEVVAIDEQPGTTVMTVTAPPAVASYLVARGSVAVQGVSLTVVDVDRRARPPTFRVALIPHTLAGTTLGSCEVGDRVNLEADIVGKYVERLVATGDAPDRDS